MVAGVYLLRVEKKVLIAGEGDTPPRSATHAYEVQVRSKAEDPNKSWTIDDPYSVLLVAAEDEGPSSLPFRVTGSSAPNRSELKGKEGLADLEPVRVQSGVDAILAELTDAVTQREDLASQLQTSTS